MFSFEDGVTRLTVDDAFKVSDKRNSIAQNDRQKTLDSAGCSHNACDCAPLTMITSQHVVADNCLLDIASDKGKIVQRKTYLTHCIPCHLQSSHSSWCQMTPFISSIEIANSSSKAYQRRVVAAFCFSVSLSFCYSISIR